ncbi:MAG: alpha-amylase [Chloroflexi bacterium]|nr:alpha-amylase [Chloroflexota bacterium]OJV88173.1 MAG: alpha-amylase [Chloroflexi bacterium 54-19]
MQTRLYIPPELKVPFEDFWKKIEPTLQADLKLSQRDCDIFWLRLERYFSDFYRAFSAIYGQHPDFDKEVETIALMLANYYLNRPEDLKILDLSREITPDWFQWETMVGGIFYVDKFAGNLKGVQEKLDYMGELGLNYVHLMPLLKPRPGQNDGGYAVMDYREVNPDYGTMGDLQQLASAMHERGISLCVDLVVNHTAKEHEWAQKARAGDPYYQDYFFFYDDRTTPDAYEKTLPEVFPDFKPGSFTFYPEIGEKGKWVWTTFYEYQWDLNLTNPAVFREMLENMLYLANKGVDILRLDAVPFMWKRLGTNCQNQPEVYQILQAYRAAARIVAPGVIFKAEAIVAPLDLIHYLGTGQHTGKECEIAYNNSLMVQLWSALASTRVDLMNVTMEQIPATPILTTWVTYVRCHDDIGWAITDENSAAVGENAFAHRKFLNEFYSGLLPYSYATGEIFQYNPRTGDGRISGMAASLAGLEKAVLDNDPEAIRVAIERIVLLYSVIFSFGGIPLIYMGDEIGLFNDYTYLNDPQKALDNRWMHRPAMDWDRAAQRHDPTTIPGKIYQQIQVLIQARKGIRELHSGTPSEIIRTGNPHVLAYARKYPGSTFVGLANFSDQYQAISSREIEQLGLWPLVKNLRWGLDKATSWDLNKDGNQVILAPFDSMWLVKG